MTYAVAFERGPGWLRVHLCGAGRDFDDTLEAWRRIAAEVAASRPPALLVVSEIRGEPFTVEQVDAFVRGMRGLGLEALRIAYVYPQAAGWGVVEAAQIFAMEAGFEVCAFADELTACTWLRHGER